LAAYILVAPVVLSGTMVVTADKNADMMMKIDKTEKKICIIISTVTDSA